MTRPKNWLNYNKQSLMTDDCLKLLKFLSHDIFRYKIVRFLTWFTFITFLLYHVLAVYYVVYKLEANEVYGYLSSCTAFLYPLVGLWALVFRSELMQKFQAEFTAWTIDTAGTEIRRKIERNIKIISVFAVANFMIALLAGCYFIPQLPNDTKTSIALRFIEDRFPHQRKILEYIYRVLLIFLAPVMITHSYQIIYYTQHARFQLFMLQVYILNIDRCEACGDYQNEIKMRLIFCIKRSVECLTTFTRKVKQIRNLIISFALGGCLFGIGIVLILVSEYFTPEYYPRLGLTCTSAAGSFATLIWAGQSMESDIQEGAHVLNKVSWYNFDKSNKVLYLIFMTHLMKERKIKFSENYSLNYELGIAIVKGIYSTVSVFVSMM